ncbi:MAG: ATP synthase F1 subunit gamma [bacterium]|nr:ATP synthase F1 subunit gamma [bacterium]
MASTKAVKQRIRSVKNTAQITKAMEVVSATKMRRSQGFALAARPYAVASLEMMENLLERTPEELIPPLLTERKVQNSLLLVITSDKGLAGAFNANVLKKAESWIGEKHSADKRLTLVTVGKKARDYLERRSRPVLKSYWGFGDYSTLEETQPIATLVLDGFLSGRWDEAEAVYMNFRSTLRQEVTLEKVLPATREGLEAAVAAILPERGRYAAQASLARHTERSYEKTSSMTGDDSPRDSSVLRTQNNKQRIRYNFEYKFEPSPAEILTALVPQLIRVHLHHIILESNASEHSARMVAMKNASDNARELIGELTLLYNKARQAGITQELTEITAGAEALNG